MAMDLFNVNTGKRKCENLFFISTHSLNTPLIKSDLDVLSLSVRTEYKDTRVFVLFVQQKKLCNHYLRVQFGRKF